MVSSIHTLSRKSTKAVAPDRMHISLFGSLWLSAATQVLQRDTSNSPVNGNDAISHLFSNLHSSNQEIRMKGLQGS